MAHKPKSNSTLRLKVALRRRALREIGTAPVVLETHGGTGQIWLRCYANLAAGVVAEKDPRKAELLAVQRPTWAVYECDAETGLAAGAGSHLAVNFLDIDPYGSPWPFVRAFLGSDRPLPDRLDVLVNDGLRKKARVGGAWNCRDLEAASDRLGAGRVFAAYLEVARDLMRSIASAHGYTIAAWRGYYCGAGKNMTHYWATLERERPSEVVGVVGAEGATSPDTRPTSGRPARGRRSSGKARPTA